uniref:Uncharacterized protein n=1 Tax=Triticum urartu TaxID=4572 RepID=A0A8R7P7Q8_TRIUA
MNHPTGMLLLLRGPRPQVREVGVRRNVRHFSEFLDPPRLSPRHLQPLGQLHTVEPERPVNYQIPVLGLPGPILLLCHLGGGHGELGVPFRELQRGPSVHPDDAEVLRVPEADGVVEVGGQAEVVLEVRDPLDEDAAVERHHEQLAELGDGEALGLVAEVELVEVEALGGGGEAEPQRVDALLHDLEDAREALEERDEAALAGEPQVAAEAAEVAQAHDPVRVGHEDVAQLEDQLQLLVPLDHVVERHLLAALHGGRLRQDGQTGADAQRRRRRRGGQRVEREGGAEE